MRRILIITAIAAVGILAFYLFYEYRKQTAPSTDAIRAVPVNAALVFTSADIRSFSSELKETNLIWQELMGLPLISRIDSSLGLLDSILMQDESLMSAWEKQPVVVSMHRGGNVLEPLFALKVPPGFSVEKVSELANLHSGTKASAREYQGIKLYSVETAHGLLHYFLHQQVLVLSFSASLLESSFDNLKGEVSLLGLPVFKDLFETRGLYVDANVFANLKELNAFLATHMNAKGEDILNLSEARGWAVLDLSLKPSAILLNGFTGGLSENSFVSRFRNQKPQHIAFISVAPASTSAFYWLGFSHSESWLESAEDPALARQFSWIEHEAASLMTESGRHLALFSSRDPMAVMELKWLENMGSDTFSFRYRDFRIKRFPIDSVLIRKTFGARFSTIHNPLSFTVGPYVVMAGDSSAAFEFIDLYLAERTLKNDAGYPLFAENIDAEANVYFYSASGKSLDTYTSFAGDNLAADLKTHSSMLSKFQATSIQLSGAGDKFYTTAFLSFNPGGKESRQSMWELALDAPVTGRPWIVTNHVDQTREVFVQDTTRQIYLIDNKGNLLWKQKVDGEILGDVIQVDGFRNGKLQLLFNTRQKIYLIDRNGNKVNSFPVELPEPATAPLSLFDYDNNLDYRIMLPAGKTVLNYDIGGKPVGGWQMPVMNAPVMNPVLHTSILGKDYIVVADNEGNIAGLDRRGEKRWVPKVRIPAKSSGLSLEKGKDLSGSWIIVADSAGSVHRLSFSEVPEVVKSGKFSHAFRFKSVDLERDGIREYFYTDTSGLYVFGISGNEKFSLKMPLTDFTDPQNFTFPDGLSRTGFTSKSSGEVYLLGPDGALMPGFPLKGYSAFSIGDLNRDGTLELVTSGPDKTIYVYSIKE